VVSPIVEFIAREPGLAARLLLVHVDDGSRRCRVCSGGAQSGRHEFPCQIHSYATAAREMAARSHDQPFGSVERNP